MNLYSSKLQDLVDRYDAIQKAVIEISAMNGMPQVEIYNDANGEAESTKTDILNVLAYMKFKAAK
jgi:hypothetical protein